MARLNDAPGDAIDPAPGIYARIHAQVARIPAGRVATYGAIVVAARASGARQVGYALHGLGPHSKVPWHRVLNASGLISLPGTAGALQRQRLEREGVRFSARGSVNLAQYGWVAPQSE